MERSYRLGLGGGFVLGLIVSAFALLGLVSHFAEVFGRFLASPGLLPGRAMGGSLPVLFLVNGVVYATMGAAAQYALRRAGRDEKVIARIILGVVAVLILGVILEAALFGIGA